MHLRHIHDADRTKDPNAPYDASLVGVVYGLLDFVAELGIIPSLSPGVLFSQRPRSVIVPGRLKPRRADRHLLENAIDGLVSILEDNNAGIQPLIAQRSLPDLISGLAELALRPLPLGDNGEGRATHQAQLEKVLNS